jgi:hypothetical protein
MLVFNVSAPVPEAEALAGWIFSRLLYSITEKGSILNNKKFKNMRKKYQMYSM